MNSLSRFSNIQFNYSFHLNSKPEFSTTISPFSAFFPSSLFLCTFSLRKVACYYYYPIGVLALLQEIRRTGDTTQLSTKRSRYRLPQMKRLRNHRISVSTMFWNRIQGQKMPGQIFWMHRVLTGWNETIVKSDIQDRQNQQKYKKKKF